MIYITYTKKKNCVSCWFYQFMLRVRTNILNGFCIFVFLRRDCVTASQYVYGIIFRGNKGTSLFKNEFIRRARQFEQTEIYFHSWWFTVPATTALQKVHSSPLYGVSNHAHIRAQRLRYPISERSIYLCIPLAHYQSILGISRLECLKFHELSRHWHYSFVGC